MSWKSIAISLGLLLTGLGVEEVGSAQGKFQCTYTRSHELIVSFHPSLTANFRAKIHNQQELADMLLMVVTFNLEGYPFDPASIATISKRQK